MNTLRNVRDVWSLVCDYSLGHKQFWKVVFCEALMHVELQVRTDDTEESYRRRTGIHQKSYNDNNYYDEVDIHDDLYYELTFNYNHEAIVDNYICQCLRPYIRYNHTRDHNIRLECFYMNTEPTVRMLVYDYVGWLYGYRYTDYDSSKKTFQPANWPRDRYITMFNGIECASLKASIVCKCSPRKW